LIGTFPQAEGTRGKIVRSLHSTRLPIFFPFFIDRPVLPWECSPVMIAVNHPTVRPPASSGPTHLPFLEALEPRIAPAVIYVGPTAVGGQDYDDPAALPFREAKDVPVQAGDPAIFTAADTTSFYLDLKGGDTVNIWSDGWQPFIKVTGGRAFAFFLDKNSDMAPQANELTGLAVSAGARLEVGGSVDGDILAILDSRAGVISTNDLISGTQNIVGLNISGDVNGRIMAGGNINAVVVNGVEQINTGTPDGPYAYSFGGTGAAPGTGEGIIAAFDPGLRKAGGNITNVTVGYANAIWAADGGASGKGGEVVNVTVGADTDGIRILAGAGGDGIATSTGGGVGGKVSQVLIKGISDPTQDLIEVSAGDGGDAFAGAKATGGKGGHVEKIFIGYDLDGRTYIEAPNLLKDRILVSGGDGGAGTSAGAGGAALNINILAAPDFIPGFDEIQVLGGNGGLLAAGGTKAGLGGNVSSFNIQNLDPAGGLGYSKTLVQAGDASASAELVAVPGSAGVGGSLLGGTLVGSEFILQAGNGSDTFAAGGAGGSVTNMFFGMRGAILLNDLEVVAGDGGLSGRGAGGLGGSITGISAPLAKMSSFVLEAGDGGTSGTALAGAAGGRGGSISKIGDITDSDSSGLTDVRVVAGDGGDGFRGGGLGGGIATLGYFANYASLDVIAGNGGNAMGPRGTGAAGGSIATVAFTTKTTGDLSQDVNILAGNGGNATGTGKGGVGGSITKANIQAVGNVNFLAGNGGGAENKGTTGNGGSIGSSAAASGLFAFSRDGDVIYRAGDAGVATAPTPSKGGIGGSITNAVASSNKDITFRAGDGQFGGAGGNLARIGYYGVSASGVADPDVAPWGNILVQAGTGSDAPTATTTAGRGGNITTLTGHTSDFNVGLFTSTAIDTSGLQHIAYYDASLSDLNYAVFDGVGWTITAVDQAGDVGQYASLALTSTDLPVISYYDATNGDLKLATFDGIAWTTDTIAAADNVGQFSSLVLDTTDLPRIAYYNQTDKDLDFASWNGLTWDFATIDSFGDVGMYASLAYDPVMDILHAAYYAETGGNLKYAASIGGGAWTAKNVDTVGNTGLHTSIAVNPLNSNVGISYFNQTVGSIRYAEGTAAGDFAGSLKFLVDGSAGDGPGQATSVAFNPVTGDPSVSYATFFGSSSFMTVKAAEADPLTGEYEWPDDPVFVGLGGTQSSIAFDVAGDAYLSFHNRDVGSLDAAVIDYSVVPPAVVKVETVSDQSDSTFVFNAGNGGNSGRAGLGGSISGISILGGEAEFSILAGNGGTGDATGGAGGSIANVAVRPDVVVRAIAAGDGGDTLKGKGANGGTVNKVDVAGDIGFRSGQAYGFATDGSLMGGLFAGRGGFNTADPANTKLFGKAGNVTNITAMAIASIVAGRDASPQLVGTVDGIFLRGLERATVDPTGAFTNFGTANLVGGKAGDPSLPGADGFNSSLGVTAPSDAATTPWAIGATTPTDGLIAALNLTAKRNFSPLALLTNTENKKTLPPDYNLIVPTVPLA
jgi:hypothetical protein